MKTITIDLEAVSDLCEQARHDDEHGLHTLFVLACLFIDSPIGTDIETVYELTRRKDNE